MSGKAGGRIYLCGSHCEHAHDGLNSPTGCCPKGHGPYLYYCDACHKEWERANQEQAARGSDRGR